MPGRAWHWSPDDAPLGCRQHKQCLGCRWILIWRVGKPGPMSLAPTCEAVCEGPEGSPQGRHRRLNHFHFVACVSAEWAGNEGAFSRPHTTCHWGTSPPRPAPAWLLTRGQGARELASCWACSHFSVSLSVIEVTRSLSHKQVFHVVWVWERRLQIWCVFPGRERGWNFPWGGFARGPQVAACLPGSPGTAEDLGSKALGVKAVTGYSFTQTRSQFHWGERGPGREEGLLRAACVVRDS